MKFSLSLPALVAAAAAMATLANASSASSSLSSTSEAARRQAEVAAQPLPQSAVAFAQALIAQFKSQHNGTAPADVASNAVADAASAAVSAVASAASASPRSLDGRGRRPRPRARQLGGSGGQCSTGSPQCCNQQINHDAPKNVLAGLLGLDTLLGDVGLDCTSLPINAVGGAVPFSNQCKATPLCCNNVTENGLITLGCINLPLN